MRVTNQMTSNQLLLNLNKNMKSLNFLSYQSETGKKIQYASDNPIIAGRSLKFRTNIVEVEQYLSNVSQARSWLQTTENAVKNIKEALVNSGENSIRSLLVSAGGVNTISDSKIYASKLKQTLNEMLSELNTSYAGRYVFSGYKTAEKAVFDVDNDKKIDITESFSFKDIDTNYKIYVKADETAMPQEVSCYRIKLAYETNIDPTSINIPGSPTITAVHSTDSNAYTPGDNEVYFVEDTGELIFGKTAYEELSNTAASLQQTADDLMTAIGEIDLTDVTTAENVLTEATNFLQQIQDLIDAKQDLADQGLLNQAEVDRLTDIYSMMEDVVQAAQDLADDYSNPNPGHPDPDLLDVLTQSMQDVYDAINVSAPPQQIDITYTKEGFYKGEINPKVYFKCAEDGADSRIADQLIEYEVGIGNTIQVNSLAKDLLTTSLINDINDVIRLIENSTVSDKDALMKAPPDGPGLTSEQADQQITDENKFYTDLIGEKLTQLIGKLDKHSTYLAQQNSSIGSRISRLDLIENRLQDDRINYNDLKSENDYVDAAETYIRYQSALTVYNSALQTGASIIQMSLVNYI